MSPTTVVVCLCGLLRLRCRVVGLGHLPLKHFWHPHHWSTVTVLLWLGCQKWQTLTLHAPVEFLFFCSPAIRTCWKKSSSKWALLKHVTRTNAIGTCSSALYIFSLLKLPPPPRAAICYTYMPFGFLLIQSVIFRIFQAPKVSLVQAAPGGETSDSATVGGQAATANVPTGRVRVSGVG